MFLALCYGLNNESLEDPWSKHIYVLSSRNTTIPFIYTWKLTWMPHTFLKFAATMFEKESTCTILDWALQISVHSLMHNHVLCVFFVHDMFVSVCVSVCVHVCVCACKRVHFVHLVKNNLYSDYVTITVSIYIYKVLVAYFVKHCSPFSSKPSCLLWKRL